MHMTQDAGQIVGRHAAVFTTPPQQTPFDTAVDGPLLGNGDIGVAIGGTPELLRLFLSKNDCWLLKGGYGTSVKAVGAIELSMPTLAQADYRVEQRLWDATTTACFTSETHGLSMRAWVAATANILVVEFTAAQQPIDLEVRLHPAWEESADGEEGVTPAARWFVKEYVREVVTPTGVACAVSIDGANHLQLSISPGKPVTLVAAMASRLDSAAFRDDAIALAEGQDAEALRALRQAHESWWQRFWEESWVELDDAVLEQRYYLSQYLMGSSCRNREFPPSIFGAWITTSNPWWSGDYHLNYNYQAPFYGLYSSNHLEQAAVYHAPILAFMARGQWYAREAWHCRGVHYPVGIGPKGDETTRDWPRNSYCTPEQYEHGGLFYGQKSNAAYCAVNMALHWYHTYDEAYAAEVYPFIREVANFWEDYLRFEDGRYVIYDDAIHEGSGKDMNPILSLGLVRMVMALALDISRTTGVDADRRERWQQILEHMSAYPTFEKDGKTIFRLSERGMAWCDGNTLAIQHIYPAGGVGLDSDPGLLAVARNTIDVMQRWRDGNGMNSFYPAAVRVGYDPGVILRQLREMIEAIGRPNGFSTNDPHGVEHCSVVPNTINEMLVQGHEGVLRLFPAWPAGRDARFRHLRVEGAFLVSAERNDGAMVSVSILSEKGRRCVVDNPWPGRAIRLIRNGEPAETLTGPCVAFPTSAGEEIALELVSS